MKRKTTLSVLAFLFSLNSFSQSPNWLWAKEMGSTGSDFGLSAALDISGNVYTTGRFEGTVDFDPGAGVFNLTSAGSSDIFISKLDASGNFNWAKAMGGTVMDRSYSIAVDALGNVYTTGYFNGTADFDPGAGTFNLTAAGNNDFFISKLDGSGNFVWAKAMGGIYDENSLGIAIDTSANVYTTGWFEGIADFDPGTGVFNLTSIGVHDVFISKLDISGNFIWAKQMGGTNFNSGNSIILDPAGSGDIYTTGYFQGTADFDPGTGTFSLTSAGGDDIFLSKLDSSGNFIWAKAMGGTSYDEGRSITLDASGNLYVTGEFRGTVDFDPGVGIFNLTSAGFGDIFISQLDVSGNFVWAKTMGGTSDDVSQSIILDTSGNIFTSGGFKGTVDFDLGAGVFNLTSTGNYDIFISKLDDLGNFVWAKAMGGTVEDISLFLAINTSGNVHMAGYFLSPFISFSSTTLANADNTGNTSDIFIAKLDTAMTIGINEAANVGDGINLFPNPATDELYVNGYTLNEKSVIEIYDVLGEKRLTPALSKGEGVRIDVSSLAKGIYFVTVTDGGGHKAVRKIVKM